MWVDMIMHALDQWAEPVFVRSNIIQACHFERYVFGAVVTFGHDRDEFGDSSNGWLFQHSVQWFEQLINVFMSVAYKIEIQLDLAKNVQLDKDAEKSEHMLILVLTPTIVHLQIQDGG